MVGLLDTDPLEDTAVLAVKVTALEQSEVDLEMDMVVLLEVDPLEVIGVVQLADMEPFLLEA